MHTCKSLILHCIDFRLQKDLNNFAASLGLTGDFDRISLAGGVKPIVQGTDAEKAYVLGQIATSVRLHAIKNVYLINHTDCGAYGGRTAFADPEAERTAHVNDLTAAKNAIQTAHPDLTVRLMIARITEPNGKTSVDFEQVG